MEKKENLAFATHLEKIRAKDTQLLVGMQANFTDEKISFPAFLIFIPFINLIFLPKLFVQKGTKYVFAIGQGMVITLLAAWLGWIYGFSSTEVSFLLFPVLLGIAMVHGNPFYRIPVVFELYSMLNFLTF